MRLTLIVAAIACAACSSSPTNPLDSIAGNWSSWGPNHPLTPAGPLTFTLSESGNTVRGTGSFGVATYTITGTYERPNVTLNFEALGHTTTYVGVDAGDKLEVNGATFYRQ